MIGERNQTALPKESGNDPDPSLANLATDLIDFPPDGGFQGKGGEAEQNRLTRGWRNPGNKPEPATIPHQMRKA